MPANQPNWLRARYRRQKLDDASNGVFIDDLNEEHVAKWFADLDICSAGF